MKRWLLASFIALAPLTSQAAAPIVVDTARLTVSQVVPSAPEDFGGVDLGRAPAPGATRVVARAEVLRNLRESGFEPGALDMPDSVRVEGAARVIAPRELAELVRPAVEKALPRGTTLESLKVSNRVIVSPRAEVGHASISKLPRRVGALRTSGVVELVLDGDIAARVPVSLVVRVTEEAARADVQKGSRVVLFIAKRSAEISMTGVATKDANVGEVIRFSVAKTGRMITARLVSARRAEVVGR